MNAVRRTALRAGWTVRRRVLGIGADEFRPRSAGAFVRAAHGGSGGPRRTVSQQLVDDLAAFIRSYVVMTAEEVVLSAVWVIHTHCFEQFEQTPYLSVTSPEKQCGKSRLLEVLELVCRRAWSQVIPSEAVLYRTIHSTAPTLLLDEIDTIFNPRSAERYEGHRAMLNAGHRKGAMVGRCIAGGNDLVNFRVYCPKALAGIGTLPDTVADRSVPIRLKRRSSTEAVARFYYREAKAIAEGLEQRISAWVEKHSENLADVHPDMPPELSDRMQDGCECLVVIADAAGVGAEVRAALVEVLTGERPDDQESMRIRLLRDIRAAFEARKMPNGLATTDLLDALHAMEEAPWLTYYSRGLDARDLSSLLSHYGIGPTALRVKKEQLKRFGDKDVVKGYKRDHLYDAWERYL